MVAIKHENLWLRGDASLAPASKGRDDANWTNRLGCA